MQYELIDSESKLAAFRDAISGEECIAVDTEFARETTYFPVIGLVQIAGRERIACIDPLAFDMVPLLSSLLLDPEVTKVFHSCEQDLEVLEPILGALPCPVFDTQIAESLLSENNQLSYAALVKQQLDIDLAKAHTRTDWLRRPLRDGPLEYAADDVRYLLQIRENQLEALSEQHRQKWLQQECARLCDTNRKTEPDYSTVWLRVRDKQNLKEAELAVLREIAAWRERIAIAANRTRRKILPDAMLVEIAERRLNNRSLIAGIRGIDRHLTPEQMTAMADRVQAALAVPQEEWPSLKRTRMTTLQANRLQAIQENVRRKAGELGISASVLCNRKDAEKMALGARDVRVLEGWRKEVIGDRLLQILEQEPA